MCPSLALAWAHGQRASAAPNRVQGLCACLSLLLANTCAYGLCAATHRDSPKAALEHMGYNYCLASDMAAAVVAAGPKRRTLRVVTQSATPPQDPVHVDINLLGHTWTLSVSTGSSWTPVWTAWAIAVVVVAALTISALLACVIIAWCVCAIYQRTWGHPCRDERLRLVSLVLSAVVNQLLHRSYQCQAAPGDPVPLRPIF